jgi:hypothetical protein
MAATERRRWPTLLSACVMAARSSASEAGPMAEHRWPLEEAHLRLDAAIPQIVARVGDCRSHVYGDQTSECPRTHLGIQTGVELCVVRGGQGGNRRPRV